MKQEENKKFEVFLFRDKFIILPNNQGVLMSVGSWMPQAIWKAYQTVPSNYQEYYVCIIWFQFLKMELRATGSAFFSKPPPRSNFEGLVNIYDSLNFSFCIIFNLVFNSIASQCSKKCHAISSISIIHWFLLFAIYSIQAKVDVAHKFQINLFYKRGVKL